MLWVACRLPYAPVMGPHRAPNERGGNVKKDIGLLRRGRFTAALIAAAVVFAVPAFAGTAFLTGQRTTGMTKQCYYNYLGSEYTNTISAVKLCPLSMQVGYDPIPPPTVSPVQPIQPIQPIPITALLTGQDVTGTTRQCYYNYAGSKYVRTLSSVSLCPLSINVRLAP
jgi:hypothetical protein